MSRGLNVREVHHVGTNDVGVECVNCTGVSIAISVWDLMDRSLIIVIVVLSSDLSRCACEYYHISFNST